MYPIFCFLLSIVRVSFSLGEYYLVTSIKCFFFLSLHPDRVFLRLNMFVCCIEMIQGFFSSTIKSIKKENLRVYAYICVRNLMTSGLTRNIHSSFYLPLSFFFSIRRNGAKEKGKKSAREKTFSKVAVYLPDEGQ